MVNSNAALWMRESLLAIDLFMSPICLFQSTAYSALRIGATRALRSKVRGYHIRSTYLHSVRFSTSTARLVMRACKTSQQ